MNGRGQRVHRQLPEGRLRQLRLERRLSQLQVAGRAGLYVGTVSRLELGLHYPDRYTLDRLCGILGVTVEQLAGDTTVLAFHQSQQPERN
jgi:transcriptional regulator with XRE-family HTH domain